MSDYSAAIRHFLDRFGFLEGLGFRASPPQVENSKLLGDSLILRYISEHAKRRIEISYSAGHVGMLGAVSVFVFDGAGNRFSLEDWISVNSPHSNVRFLASQGVEKNEEFVERFCLEVKKVFEGDLLQTLKGSEWRSVPMDWKGYR